LAQEKGRKILYQTLSLFSNVFPIENIQEEKRCDWLDHFLLVLTTASKVCGTRKEEI
jgi:hypothetical protein